MKYFDYLSLLSTLKFFFSSIFLCRSERRSPDNLAPASLFVEMAAPSSSSPLLRDVFGVLERLNPKMQDMTRPQLESFNFAMEEGLMYAVQDLLSEEFRIKDGPSIRLWYEDVQIAKPSRGQAIDEKLYPNEVTSISSHIPFTFIFFHHHQTNSSAQFSFFFLPSNKNSIPEINLNFRNCES